MREYVFDLTAFESETPDDGLREEIVRCEDCVYRNPEASEAIWEEDGKLVCGFPEKSAYLCSLINRCVGLSGFCKWGQKKEER